MSLTTWYRKRSRFDLALALALAALAVNLGLARYLGSRPSSALSDFWVDTSYQWCIAAVAFFLLQSAGIEQDWLYWLCLSQALVGTVMLGGAGLHGLQGSGRIFQAWQAINVAFCLALAAGICYFAARRGGKHPWFVIGATLFGLGIALDDVSHADTLRTATAFGHYLYPVYLLLVWLVMTGRGADSQSAFDDLAAEQAGHVEALGRLRAEQALQSDLLSRRAIESERKRIASDLHDGVGSQLVNIIATLDPRSPSQQAIAVALEQCLLDLKIMVDSIEGEHDSVIDALARLRYRIQPSLDKLGIQMVWNVQDSAEIGSVTADKVLQILRISQEALSNAMRHSQASAIEVTCRYLASNQCLLLEICDNGRGIQAAMAGRRAVGKGLAGMRLRAETMGARLAFSSCRGDRTGTRIMLLLPVRPPSQEVGAHAVHGLAPPLSEIA